MKQRHRTKPQTGRKVDVEKTEDLIIAFLKSHGRPVTRESYLRAAYGDVPSEPLSAEEEAALPEALQDWSKYN